MSCGLACVISIATLLPSTHCRAQAAQAASPAASARSVTAASAQDGKAAATQIVTVSAMVESIDAANRTLVLRGPKGRTLPVNADDRVKNFEAIKVGDKVSAKIAQAVTVSLRKNGDGIRESSVQQVASSASGGLPVTAAGRMTTVVANIWAIDRKKNVVSLRGPKGNITDVNVNEPERLKGLSVNDQVEVQYVEAVALGVTRLPK
jgi:hypothetical protein